MEKTYTKEEAQELWFQALESGEYKQGRNVLQNFGRYCCLGVACRVYEKYVLKPKGESLKIPNYRADLRSPFDVVRDWLGLYDWFGAPRNYTNNLNSCVVMNDDKKLSFPEIAKILRENRDAYFE